MRTEAELRRAADALGWATGVWDFGGNPELFELVRQMVVAVRWVLGERDGDTSAFDAVVRSLERHRDMGGAE
jgi:hypothetical protein